MENTKDLRTRWVIVKMPTRRKILSNIHAQSILIGILRLISLLSLYRDADHYKRGRPYVYSTTVILRCYVVRIWFRIPSNNTLHYFLSTNTAYHRRIIRSCGLRALPDRRTFDRRFRVLPLPHMICAMGARMSLEGIADSRIVAADSTLVRARGNIWHRSHIQSGLVPRPGIDTDARWGFASTKGWVFGYKLHMCCSTGKLVLPLSAGVSTANMQDNQMYRFLVGPLSGVRYVVADMGYDDQKLYEFTRQKGARLVCPVKRHRYPSRRRQELARFYGSKRGRSAYRARGVSIEPLFQCVKDAFGAYVSPVYGFENVRSYLLACVLSYQIAVYWNCLAGNPNPRCVKRMLGN